MAKRLYKRILKKLNLTRDQLKELQTRLITRNVSRGPFLSGDKMCPNTTALAIKRGIARFRDDREVKRLLKQYTVTPVELWVFYALFDIPAMVSERLFTRLLQDLKSAVDELSQENRS